MHLYVLTRGQKDKVDRFISDLQAQYLTYKCNPHDKKESMLQMGVRPIELWELAFPKEHLELVCRSLETGKFIQHTNDKSKIRWVMNKICWTLRKILKLKEVPDYKKEGPKFILGESKWVDVRGVGIKEDKDFKIEMI